MEELINEITFPKDFVIRLIGTIILFVANRLLRFFGKKFTVQIGHLGSKSELRINQTVQVVCIMINLASLITLAIIWGVELRNVIIVFSSLFTIIGVAMFAQWSILSNITAGIVLFFSMPFRIGDEIEIIDKDHPIKATIENVLTFTIHLRREEGDLVIMSNTQFLQKVISIKDNK